MIPHLYITFLSLVPIMCVAQGDVIACRHKNISNRENYSKFTVTYEPGYQNNEDFCSFTHVSSLKTSFYLFW